MASIRKRPRADSKHTVEAGYIRGRFWTPLDRQGSATVYAGPPMDPDEAVAACEEHGDTAYWQEFNGLHP